jgi:NADH:ubiquinone oxidoreductase subunit 5 (subunit L)/multisubunit Na+/H+ antiporter MnhA subunit
MPLWFGFDWARAALAGVGFITALNSTLVSKIRADRKGAVAFATSGTLGAIYMVLAGMHLCSGYLRSCVY